MTTEELNALYASLRDFRVMHTETDSEESHAIYDAMTVVSATACSGDGEDRPLAMSEQGVRVTALDMAVNLYARGSQGELAPGGMTKLVMDAVPVFAGWIRGGVE